MGYPPIIIASLGIGIVAFIMGTIALGFGVAAFQNDNSTSLFKEEKKEKQKAKKCNCLSGGNRF